MIFEFEEKMLSLIDERIDRASDDELFAGGYLRGHISLAVAQCEEKDINNINVLKGYINDNIKKAKSELTPIDYVIVMNLWHELSGSH